MASAAPEPTVERIVVKPPLWQRILKWIGIAIAGLVLLVLLLVLGLNTQPGRRFLVDQANGYQLANGLRIGIGRIDGSLYGAMTIRDLRLYDPKGLFAQSPQIRLDWRPFAYVNGHVDVRSLTSPVVQYIRNPELIPSTEPTDPNAPLLPDLDIDVGQLRIDQLQIGAQVAGRRSVARIEGRVKIADGHAQVFADAATLRRAGVAGGDRLALRLDAVPDDNRLDIGARLVAPVGGFVGSMASLRDPLTLTLDGNGSWAAWTGRLAANLGAGRIADLAIQARNGTFDVRGPTRPGLYLTGPVERLTAPQLDVALTAALAERRADTRLQLRSDAFVLAAQGLLDLGQSRFGDLRVETRLLTPGAIAENLNGRDVRAAVVLDGAFATPTVNYKLSADAIGFGEMVVRQVYAEGLARVDADRILVPIKARATAVEGLNAAVGGLVTNVAIDGDLAYQNGTFLSDNLRIRSDRVDATAVVVADLPEGNYTGALKGRINQYRVDSIGILNVSTDADLYSAPGGGFGIRGRVVAQTTDLFNEGARNFLGGNAVARVSLNYTPQGIIRFSDLRLNAPAFRITRGEGAYDPAGPLLVSADAYSDQYGPLFARVSGSVAQPVVLVRAPRPGVGIGLVDLTARVRGTGETYLVNATGGTNYGPFAADVRVATAPALTVAINPGTRFAGMNLTGRVQQTGAGPFAGQVNFAGSGINGQARLANQGGSQRADVDARAYQAAIPGVAGITIGRAIVDATAVLYPNGPSVIADAQVANLRAGSFVLRSSRAKVNYRNGSGTAQALAEGSSGVPFRVAANAALSPSLWRVALQGQGNNIPFRTVGPARIAVENGGYRLLPTRIDFDQGSMRLAGNYGRGMALQARLDRLDLSIANAFVPGLGLGGTATGQLAFNQAFTNAFPTAEARVNIDEFTRSSLASVSTPVDVVFLGRLVPSGGNASALIKRGTTTVGRMVARLDPVGGGGAWTSRLLAAPLSGGIRYNGPAGVLFSLAGLADQQLNGNIGVAADFSGRVNAPQLAGVVRANALTYENESYGTRLTNMAVDGRFTNDRFVLNQLRATAGDGSLSAQGSVGLAADAGFPMDIRVDLQNARLARSDALGAIANGQVRVQNGPQTGALISGQINLPEVRYQVIRQGAADVPELTGIRRKSEIARAAAEAEAAGPQGAATANAAPPGLFKLDLRIRADNRLYVSGMGLESEWEADLRVGGTSADPRVSGQVELVRGEYSFAGKRFEVTQGLIEFTGGALTNPNINITASTTAEGITANIVVTGTAQNPRLSFTSTPALAQDEVLARLLFGSSVTNLSATEAIQLAAALNSLRGSGGGGLNPLGKLRTATGIDRLRILGSDQATGRGTALAAGQYLTDDIYIEIITDARGFTATQLEIALSKALSVLSQTGSFGGSNVTLRYSRDY